VVGEKVFPFSAGDVCFIPPGEMHKAASRPETRSRWSYLFLDPARLLVHVWPKEEPALDLRGFYAQSFRNVVGAVAQPEICWLVGEIVSELRRMESGFRSSVRGLAWALMVRLGRLAPVVGEQDPKAHRAAIIRIAPALQQLSTQYSRPLDIGALCGLCGVSPTHLRRLFRRAVGRSPLEYLVQLRLQMAAALLRSTDYGILRISMEVGYTTLSSFNRHFKRHFGMPPRDWRRKGQASRR